MKHKGHQRPRQTRRPLPSTTEILRGSLLRRPIRHRSGCAVCARGNGHPVWVFTVSYPGAPTNRSAFGRTETPRPTMVSNYRKLKDTSELSASSPRNCPAGGPPKS